MARLGTIKKTRAERSEAARDSLFQAAAEVVGEYGYIEASISRITQRANLAQGTFYNYFESRQGIFDELLPVLGTKMLIHLQQQVSGSKTFLEKEERSFRALFSFLKRVPHFMRILNEAAIFAPRAHELHIRNVSSSYLRFLQKARENREIIDLTDDELEALICMLLAAREHLAKKYMPLNDSNPVPEEAIGVYMKIVSNGIIAK